MAIDPKERLKDFIEHLNEDEARELLDKLESSGTSESSFDDVKDVHDDIKDRFAEAFHELAQ